ncbi:MAG: hypothetical protein KDD76_02985, partial [Rickettsiales bacterium]|nr:hypothetical protein [Rickettsiales bacterium]
EQFTGYGFVVQPYVSVLPQDALRELRPNPAEVQDIYLVPLSEFRPQNAEKKVVMGGNEKVGAHKMPYMFFRFGNAISVASTSEGAFGQMVVKDKIWGTTAIIGAITHERLQHVLLDTSNQAVQRTYVNDEALIADFRKAIKFPPPYWHFLETENHRVSRCK